MQCNLGIKVASPPPTLMFEWVKHERPPPRVVHHEAHSMQPRYQVARPPRPPLTCGSIISGHRRALSIMMALSMLKVSLGRPAMTHARTWRGSNGYVSMWQILKYTHGRF